MRGERTRKSDFHKHVMIPIERCRSFRYIIYLHFTPFLILRATSFVPSAGPLNAVRSGRAVRATR